MSASTSRRTGYARGKRKNAQSEGTQPWANAPAQQQKKIFGALGLLEDEEIPALNAALQVVLGLLPPRRDVDLLACHPTCVHKGFHFLRWRLRRRYARTPQWMRDRYKGQDNVGQLVGTILTDISLLSTYGDGNGTPLASCLNSACRVFAQTLQSCYKMEQLSPCHCAEDHRAENTVHVSHAVVDASSAGHILQVIREGLQLTGQAACERCDSLIRAKRCYPDLPIILVVESVQPRSILSVIPAGTWSSTDIGDDYVLIGAIQALDVAKYRAVVNIEEQWLTLQDDQVRTLADEPDNIVAVCATYRLRKPAEPLPPSAFHPHDIDPDNPLLARLLDYTDVRMIKTRYLAQQQWSPRSPLRSVQVLSAISNQFLGLHPFSLDSPVWHQFPSSVAVMLLEWATDPMCFQCDKWIARDILVVQDAQTTLSRFNQPPVHQPYVRLLVLPSPVELFLLYIENYPADCAWGISCLLELGVSIPFVRDSLSNKGVDHRVVDMLDSALHLVPRRTGHEGALLLPYVGTSDHSSLGRFYQDACKGGGTRLTNFSSLHPQGHWLIADFAEMSSPASKSPEAAHISDVEEALASVLRPFCLNSAPGIIYPNARLLPQVANVVKKVGDLFGQDPVGPLGGEFDRELVKDLKVYFDADLQDEIKDPPSHNAVEWMRMNGYAATRQFHGVSLVAMVMKDVTRAGLQHGSSSWGTHAGDAHYHQIATMRHLFPEVFPARASLPIELQSNEFMSIAEGRGQPPSDIVTQYLGPHVDVWPFIAGDRSRLNSASSNSVVRCAECRRCCLSHGERFPLPSLDVVIFPQCGKSCHQLNATIFKTVTLSIRVGWKNWKKASRRSLRTRRALA
ncbi:hypothetical protein B0H13DRAFT_3896 [Mycena leptocephala]|nr:hypothetical protein B0H13DRAFT_3896 [Mycena leptocephala]